MLAVSSSQKLNSVYQSNLTFTGIKNSTEINADSEAGTWPGLGFWAGCSAELCFAQVGRAGSRSSLAVMDEQGSEAAGIPPAAQLAEQQRSVSGRLNLR